MTNEQKGGIAVAIALTILAVVYLCDGRFGAPHFYRAGKAVACADGSIFENRQAEIIKYGLQDVQGLALDENNENLYIAEANRQMLILDLTLNSEKAHRYDFRPFQQARNNPNCLDGACERLDIRDVAILKGEAMIAQNGKGIISRRALDNYALGKSNGWEPGQMDPISAPAGLWGVDQTLFVTDNPPDLSTPAQQGKKKSKPSGALYAIHVNQTADQQAAALTLPNPGGTHSASQLPATQTPYIGKLADSLYRPSGVVAKSDKGPVYVTEEDDESVKWAIFNLAQGKWHQDGYLASVLKSSHTIPHFLGLAIWKEICSPELNNKTSCSLSTANKGENNPEKLKQEADIIFAAGPTGLYAFDSGGASVGRMVFDEPVSGVAVSTDFVYLTVGQTLCRISLDSLSESLAESKAWKNLQTSAKAKTPTVVSAVSQSPQNQKPQEEANKRASHTDATHVVNSVHPLPAPGTPPDSPQRPGGPPVKPQDNPPRSGTRIFPHPGAARCPRCRCSANSHTRSSNSLAPPGSAPTP